MKSNGKIDGVNQEEVTLSQETFVIFDILPQSSMQLAHHLLTFFHSRSIQLRLQNTPTVSRQRATTPHNKCPVAQSAEAAEYTDCISTES